MLQLWKIYSLCIVYILWFPKLSMNCRFLKIFYLLIACLVYVILKVQSVVKPIVPQSKLSVYFSVMP